MVDLDDLRAAYRVSWTGDDADHLAEDSWVLLASDGLGTAERDGALDHIPDCPRCAQTYKSLIAVRAGAGAFDPDAPPGGASSGDSGSAKRRWWGGLSVLALAASVVLVISLPSRTPTAPGGDSDAMVVRSAGVGAVVSLVSPVDEIVDRQTTGDVVLRWETHDEAGPFVVEILDADGELVWTSPPTLNGEAVWPEGVTAPSGRYYWRVLSSGPVAGRLASGLVSFDFTGVVGVSANLP